MTNGPNASDEVGETCGNCGERYLTTAWQGPGRLARRGCGCRVAIVVTDVERAETCAAASQARAEREQLTIDGGSA